MALHAYELNWLTEEIVKRIERDPDAPHYCEATFRRKLLTSHQRDLCLQISSHPPEIEYLLRSQWGAVADHANLTSNQQSVFEMRLSGWTFEEIGRQRGHSKQASQNIFRQALKKLVRTWMADPISGLADVYRQETMRGLRPRPRR